jgi:hypothetical protein
MQWHPCVSWRRGHPVVSGQQRAGERLGQGDVLGVIGTEVVPQLPRAVDESQGWVPDQRQDFEVIKRLSRSRSADFPAPLPASEHAEDLDIKQVRGCQLAGHTDETACDLFMLASVEKPVENGGRIDDDHAGSSRMARSAFALDSAT